MLSKLTSAAIILWATLTSIPAHADPVNLLSPQTVALGTSEQATKADTPAPPDPNDTDKLNLSYLKGYFIDTGKIVASPIHWDTKDWLTLGAVVGGTSALFLVDQKVKNFTQSHQSRVATGFATVGNDLGNPLYVLPPVGAFYLYGYLADDHKARKTSLLALESFAISGVMTDGLKMLADRHRPNTGATPMTWDGPSFSLKNLSFSSGHTATAFSIATVFAGQYKDNPFVPPIAYGLAALTGLSRVYSNEHWSSDVFFGAAIGYFVGQAVLRYHRDDKGKLLNLSITPNVSKEMTGLTVKYDF